MKIKLVILFIASIALFSCQFPKQDSNSTEETTYSMDGAIQKGPFQKGSDVTVQEVDKNLDPTGRMYTTTTKDDFGSFALESKFSSQYVEVASEGYYFNECDNVTANAKISLRTYGDLSLDKPLNLNVLTTIAHGRIKTLVSSGLSFAPARDQAESELLNLLGITIDSGIHFYEFSLESGQNDAALLLAVSATLQKGRSVSALSLFLADLAEDFADDGTISNTELITKLRDSAAAVDVTSVVNNLKKHYQSRTWQVDVPDFSSYQNILKVAGGIISKPLFNLASGTYIEAKTIEITAPSGAQIRYTIDNITPTEGSLLYSSPLTIAMNSDVTLKAVAIINGVVSEVSTAKYSIKEGRKGEDYINAVPGTYTAYQFDGFKDGSSITPYSFKVFLTNQQGTDRIPYSISFTQDSNQGMFGYLTPPVSDSLLIIGDQTYGSALGANPWIVWMYYKLVKLPKTVIFGDEYNSYGVKYKYSKLDSWDGQFSDLIAVDFDSTNFLSGIDGSLDEELKGTGKFYFAKGKGLVYFELTHNSSNTQPLNKKTILKYQEQGSAYKATFSGTYNISGFVAEGYVVAPASAKMKDLIAPESYAQINNDAQFSFKYYFVPNTNKDMYFTFYRTSPGGAISTRLRVLVSPNQNLDNIDLGEIGGVGNGGLVTAK